MKENDKKEKKEKKKTCKALCNLAVQTKKKKRRRRKNEKKKINRLFKRLHIQCLSFQKYLIEKKKSKWGKKDKKKEKEGKKKTKKKWSKERTWVRIIKLGKDRRVRLLYLL